MRLLKIVGFTILALVGLAAAFVIYPNLSEDTKWGLMVTALAIAGLYQFGRAQDRQNNFRYRVEEDLRQIKKRLGID